MGHGYEPWRVATALMALFIITTLVIWGGGKDAFSPETGVANAQSVATTLEVTPQPTTATPPATLDSAATATLPASPRVGWLPVLYAMEIVLPAISFGQFAAWPPDPGSAMVLVLGACKLAGWILTALTLASLTGLLKKT